MEIKQKVIRWAKFLSDTRKFFDSKGFFEVTTPLLVEAGAFESCIDTLKVLYSDGHGELNSSPEFEMKAVLSETSLPIYQLAKCFRDDPPTGIHFKEFTMLEFYHPGWSYYESKELVKEYVQFLSTSPLTFEEVSMRDLVHRSTGIDFEEASSVEMFKEKIQQIGVHLSEDDTWEDIFLKLLVERVESSLNPQRPTLVTDYPAALSALAAIKPGTSFAERFELYWKGMELANGCTELRESEELLRRFKRERFARERQAKVPHPYPSRLFKAIKTLPPCSGVAMGMDRLFLCLCP